MDACPFACIVANKTSAINKRTFVVSLRRSCSLSAPTVSPLSIRTPSRLNHAAASALASDRFILASSKRTHALRSIACKP